MSDASVLEFTDANFDELVLQSDLPVLVDFWAEWCMPCRIVAPTIEEVAKEYAGKVSVGKLDTDANKEVAVKFGITAIPTIILFNAGEVAHKFVGVKTKQDFAEELDKLSG